MPSEGLALIDRRKVGSRRRIVVPSVRAGVGLGIVVFFILLAVLGPLLAPYPAHAEFRTWQPPSGVHPLGTDNYGADVLSQLIIGARESVEVGMLAGLLSGTIGTAVGLLSGYSGGILGEVLMRLVDLLLVLPSLALIIVIGAFVPSLGSGAEILIIGGLSWLWVARAIRSQVLSERNRPYVDVARVAGMRGFEIMTREILPNIVPIVVAQTVLVMTAAVLVQAALSFLGIGNPTAVSWGEMLSLAFADDAIIHGAWWWIIPPGVCIAVFSYGFVLYGNSFLARAGRVRRVA